MAVIANLAILATIGKLLITIYNPQGNPIKCWRTDNNGPPQYTDARKSIIRKWAIRNKRQNINGLHLAATCDRNDLVLRRTIFLPKNGDKAQLATWRDRNAAISKQHFFTIHREYRNSVLNIYNNNIDNAMRCAQRRIIMSTIPLKLKRDYRNKLNNRPAYDLSSERQSGGILPDLDLDFSCWPWFDIHFDLVFNLDSCCGL